MFEGVNNYPLTWPATWPRTSSYKRQEAQFRKSNGQPHSITEGSMFVLEELRRLGAKRVVISSNMQYRKDGIPYSRQTRLEDPGVAVYFELAGKPRVLACDRWLKVEDNLWAIGKHVEAIRGQERWGVGTIEQAFTGYVALPEPAKDWWIVLGVSQLAGFVETERAYRNLVKQAHPDAGGSHEEFLRVQGAWEGAKRERGW